MKQIILDKLVNILNSGINTEEKTLYLIAQIRKIREQEGAKKTNLDFFRDWLLHNKLTSEKATKFFLNEFEKYVDNKDIKSIALDFKSREADFFKFNKLKIELREFLIGNKLPSDLTDDANHWFKFIKLLVEILKECPITSSGGKIDSLTLTEDNSENICFRFHLRDRKEVIKIKLKIKQI